MSRSITRFPLASLGLVALLLSGCSGVSINLGSEEPSPSPSLDTSSAAFEEFSGVDLPDEAENADIRTENDEYVEPLYLLHYTGTAAGAEDICTQVGNWLPYSQAVSKEEREKFGVNAAAVKAAGEEVRGCGAITKAKEGVQVEGLVLYPDPDTAEIYLRAYKMGR